MNENVQTIFGLLGGLALFLFGMNSMSDALQKAAGEKMKSVLAFLTKNPLMGALAGALVTAVLQSSSATTVMVIGFVSAGLMSLPQAISVIFGANIGTTMTAQLMAFKITDFIYPIIFVGFIIFFVFKNEKIKSIGMVIFSFGLLFEGIEIMGSVMKPLANSEIFINLMGKVADIPVLGIVLGTVMTLIVQSSSATIAVLQNFASQAGPTGASIIGLTGAIPILLGDNIGTTITALIASIGQSKNAKRTAIAHSIFNISGSIVFVCIIPWFAKFIQFISPKGNEIDVISRQIANAHTTFNVVCTLIWLPLIPLMVKIVKFLVRGDDTRKKQKASFLDDKIIGQAVPSMYLISEELDNLSDMTSSVINSTKSLFSNKKIKGKSLPELKHSIEMILDVNDKISDYISKMFSNGKLSENQADKTAGLLYVSENIGRIAQRCSEIAETAEKVKLSGKKFSKDAITELNSYFSVTEELFNSGITSVRDGDLKAAQSVFEGKSRIRELEKDMNKAHLKRVKNKSCDMSLTGYYSKILYCIDRIADNCVSIAEEAQDGTMFITLAENYKGELESESSYIPKNDSLKAIPQNA